MTFPGPQGAIEPGRCVHDPADDLRHAVHRIEQAQTAVEREMGLRLERAATIIRTVLGELDPLVFGPRPSTGTPPYPGVG